MDGELHVGPVIESCSFERIVRKIEFRGFDDVEMRINPDAQPADVPGILGNRGMKESDVEHFI